MMDEPSRAELMVVVALADTSQVLPLCPLQGQGYTLHMHLSLPAHNTPLQTQPLLYLPVTYGLWVSRLRGQVCRWLMANVQAPHIVTVLTREEGSVSTATQQWVGDPKRKSEVHPEGSLHRPPETQVVPSALVFRGWAPALGFAFPRFAPKSQVSSMQDE